MYARVVHKTAQWNKHGLRSHLYTWGIGTAALLSVNDTYGCAAGELARVSCAALFTVLESANVENIRACPPCVQCSHYSWGLCQHVLRINIVFVPLVPAHLQRQWCIQKFVSAGMRNAGWAGGCCRLCCAWHMTQALPGHGRVNGERHCT